MELLKGKAVADSITENNLKRVEALKNKGIFPALALVRIGENPGDISYEKGAMRRAFDTGIMARSFVYDKDISQEELLEELDMLNKDPYIHGILIFRPLPSHIDDSIICERIAPEKDMDGITSSSMAGVFLDSDTGYPPCTAEACMEILDYYDIDIEGKKTAVFGRSPVIGKPVAMMMMKRNATVTICHSRTKAEDFADIGKNADLVVAAIGKAKFVKGSHLGEGQTILDVGINVDDNGKLCGDVDFDDIEKRKGAITPVPGGIGSITTAVLMKHVINAAEKTV